MHVDRAKGAAAKAKDSVKEAIGKITGDARGQAEGHGDKVSSHAQAAVGGIGTAARGTPDLKAKP